MVTCTTIKYFIVKQAMRNVSKKENQIKDTETTKNMVINNIH